MSAHIFYIQLNRWLCQWQGGSLLWNEVYGSSRVAVSSGASHLNDGSLLCGTPNSRRLETIFLLKVEQSHFPPFKCISVENRNTPFEAESVPVPDCRMI